MATHRDYASAPSHVRETYRLNHQRQTLEFVHAKKAEYGALDHARMSVWEALDRLAEVVDESDPDLDLPQPVHALQTARHRLEDHRSLR